MSTRALSAKNKFQRRQTPNGYKKMNTPQYKPGKMLLNSKRKNCKIDKNDRAL
jgi:hypothetical protein